MVMPVVQASEVRPSEHFIGTQHVKAALVQSQCALGWIACDSHDVNVATQKRTVKRSEPQQWFECWRRTMPCSMRSERLNLAGPRSGVGSNELLVLAARPDNLHLAVLHYAVAQVEVNQALVRHTSLSGHAFEVVNYVLRKTHRDWLLELGRVRVPAGFHF